MSRSLLLGLVAIVGGDQAEQVARIEGRGDPKSVLPRSRRLPKAKPQAQRIALGDIALRLFVLTGALCLDCVTK